MNLRVDARPPSRRHAPRRQRLHVRESQHLEKSTNADRCNRGGGSLVSCCATGHPYASTPPSPTCSITHLSGQVPSPCPCPCPCPSRRARYFHCRYPPPRATSLLACLFVITSSAALSVLLLHMDKPPGLWACCLSCGSCVIDRDTGHGGAVVASELASKPSGGRRALRVSRPRGWSGWYVSGSLLQMATNPAFAGCFRRSALGLRETTLL